MDVHSRSSDMTHRMPDNVEYVRVKDSGFSMLVSYGTYNMDHTMPLEYTLI